MSLKAFHIVFVLTAAAFGLGLGAWAVRDYRAAGSTASLVIAVGAFLGTAILIPFGVWFLRKLKHVSYV